MIGAITYDIKHKQVLDFITVSFGEGGNDFTLVLCVEKIKRRRDHHVSKISQDESVLKQWQKQQMMIAYAFKSYFGSDFLGLKAEKGSDPLLTHLQNKKEV